MKKIEKMTKEEAIDFIYETVKLSVVNNKSAPLEYATNMAIVEFYELKYSPDREVYGFDSEKLGVLIEKAKKQEEYFYCLKSICIDWIEKSNDIPKEIKNVSCQLLCGQLVKPKARKMKNQLRTDFLARLARILKENGFNLGKNSESAGMDNAFSIIADAANKSGKFKNITYATIHEAYYAKYKN